MLKSLGAFHLVAIVICQEAPSGLASLTILFTFQRLAKVTAELGSTAARSATCREAGNDQSRLRAIWVRLAEALVQELI
jgi:hypothetical protein